MGSSTARGMAWLSAIVMYVLDCNAANEVPMCPPFIPGVIRYSCEIAPVFGDRVKLSGAHEDTFQPLSRFGGLPMLYASQGASRQSDTRGMHADAVCNTAADKNSPTYPLL